MEEIRDIDNHLLCSADAQRGLLVHKDHDKMIRLILPPKGEILFIRKKNFTLIRRVENGTFYVHREHCNGSLMIG